MARLSWKYTGGYNPADFAASLTFDETVALKDEEKLLFVSAVASAASKALVTGLEDGQCMFVSNIGGTNAFTVKNLATDSGSSLATGKVALVIGSTTANATKIYVLN